MLTISLPAELEMQLSELAMQHGESVEAVAARLLGNYFARRQPPANNGSSLYARFKARLRDRYPELAQFSLADARRRIEELSNKIRNAMPFATPEEAQAFMRGVDHYDFERQQYLHH